MNQPLEIITQSDISLNELAALHSEGFSVMRSAHVGNMAPYNLTIAQLGIPALLVDHTITGALDPEIKGVDRNYFPEAVNTQTGNTIVAAAGGLVCRSEVLAVPDLLTPITNTARLDELHIAGLQAAIAGANVITNTEYLRKNETVAGEIISLAAQEMPELFNRLALADGTVKEVGSAAQMIRSAGIMQLNDNPRAEKTAVMIPNVVDIVANFVIEALATEQAIQYHISGPDMIKYMKKDTVIRKQIECLYSIVKENASFASQLPPSLTVELVTGADAKFSTTAARQGALDRLLEGVAAATQESAAIVAERKDFFTGHKATDSAKKASFLASLAARQATAQTAVIAAASDAPELFVESLHPGNITQYDVLQEGGLYVPAQNIELRLNSLAAIAQAIVTARKRVKP